MSGGSLDYISSSLANALDIPYGHYGEISKSNNSIDYKRVIKSNPMEDTELSLMMYDICCLLHSLEWYKSGDTAEDDYLEDVKSFKDKWLNRTDEDRISECKDILKVYSEDVINEYFRGE